MKLNKISTFTGIAVPVAIVAPMITSCSNTSSVKTVWEKKPGQQYEGYTQRCIDTTTKVKVGELAEKYFTFQKNVCQSFNDDWIRTLNNSLSTTDTGTITVETSKFDRDTLRLTSKIETSVQTQEGDKIHVLIDFKNVPTEFVYDNSQYSIVPLGLFSDFSSLSIWGLPDWEIKYEYGQDVNISFSPNSGIEEIELFYEDYAAYLAINLTYFEGVEIK